MNFIETILFVPAKITNFDNFSKSSFAQCSTNFILTQKKEKLISLSINWKTKRSLTLMIENITRNIYQMSFIIITNINTARFTFLSTILRTKQEEIFFSYNRIFGCRSLLFSRSVYSIELQNIRFARWICCNRRIRWRLMRRLWKGRITIFRTFNFNIS